MWLRQLAYLRSSDKPGWTPPLPTGTEEGVTPAQPPFTSKVTGHTCSLVISLNHEDSVWLECEGHISVPSSMVTGLSHGRIQTTLQT